MLKLLFTFVLLLVLSNISYSQQVSPAPQLTKQDYLKKSKSQKTIAWILAGTGVTSVIISIATIDGTEIFSSIEGNNKPINRFGILIFGGCIVSLSSIPFFISSGKNKRKAMSLSLKMEQVPQLQIASLVNKPNPSVILKIRL